MATPQNYNQQNGDLNNVDYENQAFDVVGDVDEVISASDRVNTSVNDVAVVIEETSFDDTPKVAIDPNEKFRSNAPSISHSVNYDDVISAEKLADNISIRGLPSTANHHAPPRPRHSLVTRRRSTRDEIEEDDDDFPRELVLQIRKTLPLKDFRNEVRARRDLEKFLVAPVVLLDVTHTSLDRIIEDLMMKLKKDLEIDERITSEAERTFFTFQDQYQGSVTEGSVDHLRETIHGIRYKPEGAAYEQSWITAVCSLPMLRRSHVGIARLRHPLNLGNKCEEVVFVIAVIAPKKEKFTKNAVEIGRTFSSLMMNSTFRHSLTVAKTEEDFKGVLTQQSMKYKADYYSVEQDEPIAPESDFSDYSFTQFGRGVYDDVKRRLPYYWSDFKDGIVGKHTIHKLVATVLFLYFACLLPDIAFGTLYQKNTNGIIDVTSCIISQTIGGLAFAFFSGQPMLVLLTTAPLALYVKVIMLVSDTFGLDFRAMYAMTGLWNSIFLVLQSLFNLSKLMKYSSRSTEEIFGFFIALAFAGDAVKATISNFEKNYHFRPAETVATTSSPFTTSIFSNATSDASLPGDCLPDGICYRPENSILFLFLMLATLWVGITLLKFDESRFLSSMKREILADYALPIAVILLSFVGSYLFREIPLEQFKFVSDKKNFLLPSIAELPPLAHLGAVGLGLCLSCLFFVDQNVSAALVNAPQNKLKKGPAYHWDLLVIGVINIPLSIFTLPWVHAALPHSPLHVKALADVEQHVSNLGAVQDEIVKVRETRLTTIFSHILIGLSLLIIPVLQYVPVAVLQGLFLYLGLSSFIGNQMFDRMMLLFTEGSSYPPNHYVRKVPQRKLHLFTFCQVVQLIIVAVFGFVDLFYLKMIFPVIILLLLPIRHKLLPKIVERKYLAVLDS